MKPLIILLSSFVISLFFIKIINNKYDFALSSRIAMSIMLVFTATGHFIFTKGMTLMIPSFIPYKETFVHLTGLFEIHSANTGETYLFRTQFKMIAKGKQVNKDANGKIDEI